MRISVCGTETTIQLVSDLERVIGTIAAGSTVEVYCSIEKFALKMREGGDVSIIVATDKRELRQFLALKDLLEDVRIILVLPCSDDALVIEAQQLRPRYIAYGDFDFPFIAMVLKKMLANQSYVAAHAV